MQAGFGKKVLNCIHIGTVDNHTPKENHGGPDYSLSYILFHYVVLV